MTVAPTRPGSAGLPSGRAAPVPPPRPEAAVAPARADGTTRVPGPRVGQVVATQLGLALPVATIGRGPLTTGAAALAGALLIAGVWLRIRRRWLFEWAGLALGYAARQRRRPVDPAPDALLSLVLPGSELAPAELAGDRVAVVCDGAGLTAILELGDPNLLLTDGPVPLPAPADLLPAPGTRSPALRVQVVLAGIPGSATGDGLPDTSYRQLTGDRPAGYERALMAVRVLRAAGWSEEDLRRALSSAVRKVSRRLAPLPVRPLGERAALGVLAELAHHDGARPARETWRWVQAGGLHHATVWLERWPVPGTGAARRLVPRLLALPAVSVTVAVGAGPRVGTGPVPADLAVRLSAGDPDDLAAAVDALRELVQAGGGSVRRLDGDQVAGLRATLPLGVGPVDAAGRWPAGALATGLDLPMGGGGLLIGASRHGTPVGLRLFRPESTSAVLVGGVRAAQILVLRSMARGARVVVQTTRPVVWSQFVGGVADPIAVIPPGQGLTGPAATPLRPVLTVVDVGPVTTTGRSGQPWHTRLLVRDELVAADRDPLARADLVVLQPLHPGEAALAGAALGLDGVPTQWLSRISDNLVAVVNRRTLRWVRFDVSPIETRLIGPASRR
nr:type VII secretion protein EccE [Micromonospora sp. DSM 115978]